MRDEEEAAGGGNVKKNPAGSQAMHGGPREVIRYEFGVCS